MSVEEEGSRDSLYFLDNGRSIWSPTNSLVLGLGDENRNCTRIASLHGVSEYNGLFQLRDQTHGSAEVTGLSQVKTSTVAEFQDELAKYESSKIIVATGGTMLPAFFIR
jgi:hypothetical protein